MFRRTPAVRSEPAGLQTTHAQCGVPNSGEPPGGPLTLEAACATQLIVSCPTAPGVKYPRQTKVRLLPLPKQQSMPNPCGGVPANPWCPGRHAAGGDGED